MTDEHAKHVAMALETWTQAQLRRFYGIPDGPEGDALLAKHLAEHMAQARNVSEELKK